MFIQLGASNEISEMYRILFVVLSASAISILVYKCRKKKCKHGNAAPAIIYFSFVFAFYFARIFGYPANIYLANIISNSIHLVACIIIFYVHYILVSEKDE